MKHKLKALASLCLALALTLCLALPAWAVGEGDTGSGNTGLTENSTGSITVSGLEAGVTVNVYRLMTVNVDGIVHQPQMPVYTWVPSVGNWLKSNTNETYKTYISEAKDDYSVTENFKDNGETNAADIAAFYDSLAAAIREKTITGLTPQTGKASQDVGQSTASCTIESLPMGNYLVLIEGGMQIYRPSAFNLVPKWQPGTGDTSGEWVVGEDEVEVKASTPTITKKVKDTTTYNANDGVEALDYAQVAIGDTVTYILEADVPQFPADAINKGYVISDNLPAGMTLNADTVKVFGGDESGQGTVITANKYKLKSTDATRPEGVTEDTETKNVDFSITFDNIVNIRESYSKIKITYTATANGNIQVVGDGEEDNKNKKGNENTAYLDYNNNPYEKPATGGTLTWKTDYDTATVYTYGIKVNKISDTEDDEGNNVYLPGAEFQVYKDANKNGQIDTTEQPIKFVVGGENNGTYRVAESTETTATDKVATVAQTGVSTGPNLTLSGLDVGTYILKETKAPDGYNLPAGTFSVTITDDKNTSATTDAEKATPNGKPEYDKKNGDNSTTPTDRTDGYEQITITNTKGFTLPTTGGMGTVLFTAGGVVLMGAGLVLLVVFLRRRRAK